ncbi:hypothetical protein [Paraburkholderia fungorum]|uniref:hypothetical protein n=1 Tax=Paraburkholderia fungorum TaxID=134537 RepID=UPI000406ADA5|nr:hypothetical protein [Paraburkholderia fungorum]PZR48481.1 MAG: hypothetical protein DI523_10760 [Paraburkholderia fungorum]
MKQEKQVLQEEQIPPRDGTRPETPMAQSPRLSRRKHRGPLFDLPPVERSQQKAFLRLLKCFQSGDASPEELDDAAIFRVLTEFYEPRRGFWQELEGGTLRAVVECYAPDFDAARERAWRDGSATFPLILEDVVFTLQLFERCAERLLDIPGDARPVGLAATLWWLQCRCLEDGEIKWYYKLERMGESGAESVLRMMGTIERAPVVTSGGGEGRPRRSNPKQPDA